MHFNMQGKTAYPKVSANKAFSEFGPLELKPTSSSNGRAVTAAKANVAFDTKFQRLNPRSGIILLFSIGEQIIPVIAQDRLQQLHHLINRWQKKLIHHPLLKTWLQKMK